MVLLVEAGKLKQERGLSTFRYDKWKEGKRREMRSAVERSIRGGKVNNQYLRLKKKLLE